jgi:hypothetical protein
MRWRPRCLRTSPATVTSKITAADPVGRLCHPKTSPVAKNGRVVAEPPMEP